MAIAVDQNYDKAQRKISTANLEQFAGVDCQLLVEKETHRPIIMDGATVGGKFKCASIDEIKWSNLKNVPDNVKNALSFIEQSLTTEQKAQVVQNLVGTFLPLAGGTVTGRVNFNTSAILGYNTDKLKLLELTGGGVYNLGATLRLYSNSDPINPGSFSIATGDEKFLEGYTTGNLLWAGKEVERVNAKGSNYIRFESGIQICFGSVSDMPFGSVSSGGISTTNVSYPLPFTTIPVVTCCIQGKTSNNNYGSTQLLASPTTTQFAAVFVNDSDVTLEPADFMWGAIGYWK